MWQWANVHPYLFTSIGIIAILGIVTVLEKAVEYHYKMNKIKWYQKNFPGVKPEQWEGYEPSANKSSLYNANLRKCSTTKNPPPPVHYGAPIIKGGMNPPPYTSRPDFTPPAHKKRRD